MRIRTRDAAYWLNALTPQGQINRAALARAFGVSRFLPRYWGEELPELYARRLLAAIPQAQVDLIDPETGITLRQMRALLRARSPPAA